jgi:hypothetical protein
MMSIHLLVRFANNLAFSNGIDTIEQHSKVIERRGAVWFAKFGKTLGVSHVERLNLQISAGINTYLFLVGKDGREQKWFRARLTEVRRTKPESKKEPFPSYYKEHFSANSARLWLRVSSLDPMQPYESRRLFVKSSSSPAAESLARSMAGMFIVVQAQDASAASRRHEIKKEIRSERLDEDMFDE